MLRSDTRQPGRSRLVALAAGVLTLFSVAGNARAQDRPGDAPKDIGEKVLAAGEKAEEKPKDGWHRKLLLGGTLNFNHSSNVVGTADGTNLQLGLLLDGSPLLVRGRQEWETSLKVQHARSRTTVVDSFVKSADNFELRSTYLYRLEQLPWLGPFVRVAVTTPLFEGYEVRAEDTVVRRLFADGSEDLESVPGQERIELTGALEPLVLSENAGVFATPLERKDLSVKMKLGLGARHILTQDGFAVSDDKGTAELELKQLSSSTQAGGVLDLNLAGQFAENVIWKVDTNLFVELASSSDEEGLSALNLELAGALSVKLAKWASLDYVLAAKRIPRILDEWQVFDGVVLTTGFNLF